MLDEAGIDRNLVCLVKPFESDIVTVASDNNGGTLVYWTTVPTFTWGIDGSGKWITAADWSPSGVPGSGDGALIDAAGTKTYTVTSAASVTVSSIVTAATATLSVTGGTFTTDTGTGSGNNAGTIKGQ